MAEDKKKSYELIPAAGDKDVGKKVFEVLGLVIADKIKLGLHERWYRNYQLRRNKHWQADSPQGVPLVSANLLFTHTQRTTNTMTDNDPTFNVVAVGQIEEGQKDKLIDLQHCTEHWWRDQEQQDVFESSVINGEQYGITIEKVIFNEDLEYRLGEVETIPVDPFHFGWYPPKLRAARDLQQCEAVLHYFPVSVRSLQREYPNLADQIKPDDDLLKELKDDERREIQGSGAKGSVMTTFSGVVRELLNFISGTSGKGTEEETIRCEMWLRDKTKVLGEPITDPKTGEVTQESKPKYTGEIRYILVCSGGVVLEDKNNPNINPALDDEEAQKTFLYDKFPFTAANSVKDTSNAWGLSDYEQLEWINMEVNKSLSQFVLEKDRSARKKLIVPQSCGVPIENFTNYVGIIEPTDAQESRGIRWLDTPQSSVDYDKAIAMFKDFFFLISGTFELDQAQTQGREVIAYKAIAALLERAATMMRGKIRSYSRLIRDRGRMYLSHVMNFYTEERWITYKDKDGKDASKPIVGSSLVMPAKLTVVSGSTLPISRVQQREEAISLADKGFIDQTELLDKLDYSNRSEVVKRMMAGPFGAVLQKLMTAQVPEPIVNYIKAVGDMDPKDLEKGLQEGQIPPFMSLMQQLMAGQTDQGPDESQVAQLREIEAKAQKTLAEAELTMAKKELTIEQIMTERVKQQVQNAGMGYDDEMMKIERAKVVHQMEEDAKNHSIDAVKTGLEQANRNTDRVDKAGEAGWNERGAKSNNIQ